ELRAHVGVQRAIGVALLEPGPYGPRLVARLDQRTVLCADLDGHGFEVALVRLVEDVRKLVAPDLAEARSRQRFAHRPEIDDALIARKLGREPLELVLQHAYHREPSSTAHLVVVR